MSNVKVGSDPIYDARSLGVPRMLVLGVQHMFAMFGATVLVPALTGLSVSATLLFAGLGTLLFHLITKKKVPAFLGSSFAFLGGYWAIAPKGEPELLPYACVGVACAGLMYAILSGLFKVYGAKKVMRFFPPIVTGPSIICIGMNLSATAINSCSANWGVAAVAIVVVIACNIWGKGMVKIIPILLGVVASYVVGAITGNVDFSKVHEAAWLGLPFRMEDTVFSLIGNADTSLIISSIITIMPIALATMIEHIGDVCAISSTVERNYLADPGLHRTLLGDGLATSLAALFGAPANTTYGENTGVLALSRVYDPRVIRIAAGLAVLLSFCPKFAALISAMPVATMGGVSMVLYGMISAMPVATMGGVSMVLYGMISAVGVRNVVENKVDFTSSRNVIIAALIMVLAIGITYSEAGAVRIGSVSLSGLAVAAIVGILLNAVLPGKDYEFGIDEQGDTSVNFKV